MVPVYALESVWESLVMFSVSDGSIYSLEGLPKKLLFILFYRKLHMSKMMIYVWLGKSW